MRDDSQMYAQVLRLQAEDGTELSGLAHHPSGERDVAVVYVHGLGSNGRSHLSHGLAAVLPAQGYGVIRGDLREADLLRIDEDPAHQEARKGGGAYHAFAAGVGDVGLWVEQAFALGYRRVVLFGHSLGSLRSTHYVADHPDDPRIIGLVLASTADLIAMHASRYSDEELDEYLQRAQDLVAAGDGNEIMPPECSVGLMRQPISADAYVDRFGPDPSWDVMDLYERGSDRAFAALNKVQVPILATFGTHKETVPVERVPDTFALLERNAPLAPSFRSQVFDGAEHFYLGHASDVGALVADWLTHDVLGDDPR